MSEPTVILRELTPGDLLAEGFFLRLNADALRHAPVIYLVRNAGEANGVPLPMAFANPCLVDLAPAFRIRGARIRSEALEATLERARECCAQGKGPFLIECLMDLDHAGNEGENR